MFFLNFLSDCAEERPQNDASSLHVSKKQAKSVGMNPGFYTENSEPEPHPNLAASKATSSSNEDCVKLEQLLGDCGVGKPKSRAQASLVHKSYLWLA